jgi:hypothetical protein
LERLIEARDASVACRTVVLALAHAQADLATALLATALAEQLQDGGVPDLAVLRARFVATSTRLPVVAVGCRVRCRGARVSAA